MTEPQIDRRCPACGASIRVMAFFCPQCGKEIAKARNETGGPNTSVVTAPLDGSAVSDAANANESTAQPITETIEEKATSVAIPPQKLPAGQVPGPAPARRPRATALAREVESDVVHRVHKLRKMSTVVLDEAAYDPSLRFVLVAAALFLLFLIIVLLNKFI